MVNAGQGGMQLKHKGMERVNIADILLELEREGRWNL